MADSAAFELVCQRLEQSTSLDRLEARGTVRLTLRAAGLEARDVSPDQMRVVVEKLLPQELTARGIAEANALCRHILGDLAEIVATPGEAASPEAIFRRLGGV